MPWLAFSGWPPGIAQRQIEEAQASLGQVWSLSRAGVLSRRNNATAAAVIAPFVLRHQQRQSWQAATGFRQQGSRLSQQLRLQLKQQWQQQQGQQRPL
jgi:hypothetical protein